MKCETIQTGPDAPARNLPGFIPAPPHRRLLWPWALLSALLLTLAFPPAELGWMAWIALAPTFYAVVSARRPRHAFALAYLFGYLHWGVVIYWIGTTVANWTHSPIGWIALILLTAIKVCWYGLFGVLAWWIGRRSTGALRVTGVAAAWAVVEWLRGQSVVAMPWSLSGYSQYRFLTIIQAADLAGVYLISFALALAGGALAEAAINVFNAETQRRRERQEGENGSGGDTETGDWRRETGDRRQETGDKGQETGIGGAYASHRLPSSFIPSLRSGHALHPSSFIPHPSSFLPPAICLAFLLVYGQFALHRSYGGTPERLALMQPNIASSRAEPGSEERDLWLYSQMATQIAPAHAALVLWPESAATDVVNDPQSRRRFQQIAERTGAFQLVGTGYEDPVGHTYNSAALFDPAGKITARYDKYWLVPMGEWVPMRPWIPFGDVFHFPEQTTRGAFDQVVAAEPARLDALICYESVFPALTRARVASGANLLVGITNDSWAGVSPQLRQHIAMSAFRAVETRRWLASAATTGITCSIAPSGRIDAAPPYGVQAVIRDVRLRDGLTPYVRFGDWFVALCAILVAVILRPVRLFRGG